MHSILSDKKRLTKNQQKIKLLFYWMRNKNIKIQNLGEYSFAYLFPLEKPFDQSLQIGVHSQIDESFKGVQGVHESKRALSAQVPDHSLLAVELKQNMCISKSVDESDERVSDVCY